MYCKYLNINSDKDFQVLAKTLDSLDKAYILAKIDAWVCSNENNNKKDAYVAGNYWMYATVNQLYRNLFSFYGCEKTLQRHLKSLEKDGFLIRERHNKVKSQRLWYRVNYGKVITACRITEMEAKGIIVRKVDEDGVISWENKAVQ